MVTLPRRQNYPSNEMYEEIVRLYTLVASLQAKLDALSGTTPVRGTNQGIQRAVSIPAASDPNATAQVYGAGINPAVSTISITSSIGVGFGSTPSFVMVISNAATFRTAIGVDAPVVVTAGTYVTGLKLTGPGNDGTITINAQGRVTAITPAT